MALAAPNITLIKFPTIITASDTKVGEDIMTSSFTYDYANTITSVIFNGKTLYYDMCSGLK